MTNDGVAIVRGKGHPARVYYQKKEETRYDFAVNVIGLYKDSIGYRNTLTVEFVWNP